MTGTGVLRVSFLQVLGASCGQGGQVRDCPEEAVLREPLPGAIKAERFSFPSDDPA